MEQITKEYLSKREVAQYVGAGERTVNNWLKQGLPSFRIGQKMLRFRRSDVDLWLEKFRAQSNNKVDEIVDETLAEMTGSKRGRR